MISRRKRRGRTIPARSVISFGIHGEVEFDVVVGRGEAQATGGEIGAAHDGVGHFAPPDVGHLAVQETGTGSGANLDFIPNPGGTGLGDVALV